VGKAFNSGKHNAWHFRQVALRPFYFMLSDTSKPLALHKQASGLTYEVEASISNLQLQLIASLI
jgi:hypothetical protein